MITLNLTDVSVAYGSRTILQPLSASFTGGTMTGIIGCNGAGKTTLLKAIHGTLPFSGNCILKDEDTVCTTQDIALIPQLGSVTTSLTVFEMVLLGLAGELGWKVTAEQEKRTLGMLDVLGMRDLAERQVRQLSGGQQQLVFMAQALVGRPKVLLLDEPTSALDLRHQLLVMDLARHYTKRYGAITLYVLHDLGLAARYSERLLLLQDGSMKLLDIPDHVLRPEILEQVYQVSVDVEKNSAGYVQVTPLRPLENRKGAKFI